MFPRVAKDLLEHVNGALVGYLRQPEDGLLTCFLIRIVARDVQKEIGSLWCSLLRQQEHCLPAKNRGARVTTLENLLQYGHRTLCVHLKERVQSGDTLVVIVITRAVG